MDTKVDQICTILESATALKLWGISTCDFNLVSPDDEDCTHIVEINVYTSDSRQYELHIEEHHIEHGKINEYGELTIDYYGEAITIIIYR